MPTFAVLFAAAQVVAAPAALPSSACLAVDVVPSPGAHAPRDRRPREGSGLSATKTVDLELHVRMQTLRGDHLLHLKLFTPRGYLYQTMTVPFHFDARRPRRPAGEPAPAMRVAGFPRALPIQSLEAPSRARPAADRVTARLPVAGTSIALGSLLGRWTAVPYLDDAAEPCGRAGTFVITE
jgi:hypothetical protein